MLTISKPLSSSQVQSYHKLEFTADSQSYYKQGGAVEGEWQGELAKTFGLAGAPVDAQHFALLTEGKNPQTEEQIVRHKAGKEYANPDGTITKPVEHRAGWDATFSAPKSVSLTALVGGDERVREAHRAAVTTALAELEKYTQARLGGNKPGETTGKFLAAKFEHDTARPVDGYAAPQLHTHAVIFNMTQREDGTTRALQPKSMFDTQSFASAVYQSELTLQLRNLGYELTTGRSGAPEIKGYSLEYLDASSLRSQQIREQLEKSGFQGPAAAQIAAHATRDSKQLVSPEEVLAAHRQLAAEFGNQASKVVAEARERVQVQERTPDQAKHAQAAVSYAKEHIYEREAVADRRGILRDALRHGMGETTLAHVEPEFKQRQAQGEFRQAASQKYDTDLRYTTPATVAAERAVIANMKEGQGAVEPMMTPQQAQKQAATRTFLNPAQRTVIEEVLTSRDRVHGLQGLAGTGKTTTLEAIKEGAERSGYAVAGFAPTSKAAAQLREAGINAGTLQGFLAKGPGGQDASDPASRHLYMLDESSFASTRQMRAFLEKIGPADRVLVIGDTGQHQGVDAGRPFEQMQQAGMRTALLDQIMRQRKTPELLTAVEHLAKGETKEGITMLQNQGRVTELADAKERIAAIVKDYVANPKNTIIISPDNASRREINQAVRVELQANGTLAKESQQFSTLITRSDMTGADRAWAARYVENDILLYAKGSKALGIGRDSYATVTGTNPARNEITVRREDGESVTYDPARLRGVNAYRELPRELATGDRLQFTAPVKSLGVANRDLGTVTGMDGGRITVKMDGKDGMDSKDGRTVSFDPQQMRHFDHGYAVTSHSSQGMTLSRVLVNIDTEAARGLVNTRLAYVAISRAENDVRIYTNKIKDLAVQLATKVTKTVAVEYDEKAKQQSYSGHIGPKQKTDAPEIPLSRTAELRHAVGKLGTEDARIGVNLLEQQGRIHVEADPGKRLAAMAREYAAQYAVQPEKTVAMVASPAEQKQLNQLIRAELQQTGVLSPDARTLPVLVERTMNNKHAAHYEVGDRIHFRAGSKERGIQPNSSALVLAVSSERNQLTVQTQDGEARTYNPAKLKVTRQSKVYREESRELEIGDRIRMTADHKPENIRAGDFARIEAIRGIGALQVKMESGKIVELSPALARHIEHGYAVDRAKPVSADRLLVSVESPTQLARESPLYKSIAHAQHVAFYTPERSALHEAKTPEELQQLLARTGMATQEKVGDTRSRQGIEPESQGKGRAQTPERASAEAEQARLYGPLDRVLSHEKAGKFEWVAETGTIQTYRHQETERHLHIDSATGQFYDQKRNAISQEAAWNHIMHDNHEHTQHNISPNLINSEISQQRSQDDTNQVFSL